MKCSVLKFTYITDHVNQLYNVM